VAILDSICIVLIIGSAQGKQAYILDIGNAFHNTIEFDSSKRTYITLPPFFVEYLRLRWATHPGLATVEQDPSAFVIQNFCSFKGQKDAGKVLPTHAQVHEAYRASSQYIWPWSFFWKRPSSELFIALATYGCLVLCDDRAQFLDLKAQMETMFEVTLQEFAILRFLNLRIIQSSAGIIIDQMDHIVETSVTPYSKNQDTSELISITSPFPTDSSF
jgi:hypothetical protein